LKKEGGRERKGALKAQGEFFYELLTKARGPTQMAGQQAGTPNETWTYSHNTKEGKEKRTKGEEKKAECKCSHSPKRKRKGTRKGGRRDMMRSTGSCQEQRNG